MKFAPLLVLALLGCKKDEEPEAPPGVLLDLSVASGVDVQTGIVPLGSGVLARSVNSLGIAVASGTQRVTVGSTETDVAFDATGYGAITLAAAGSSEVSGAVRPATVHAVDVEWLGLAMEAGEAAPTDGKYVAAATRGWLVAGLYEVWWVSPNGQEHPVLKLPDGQLIGGLRTAHVDSDGVLDGVVWAGDTVVLLRGRALGGMSWGAAIQAEGYAAASAAVGDCTGDGTGDVAIGWVSPNDDHHIQVLVGDGLWALDSYPPTSLAKPPDSIAIGDNRGDGLPQITLMFEDGDYERYQFESESEAFRPTGPSLSGGFPAGAKLESGSDMNGDGGDELFFLGPKNPAAPRVLSIYNLLSSPVTWFALDDYVEAEFAIADMDGDNLADAAVIPSDGEIVSLTHTGSGYLQNQVGSVSDVGPLGMSDLDGDRAPELFVAGQDLWGYWGGSIVTEDDGDVWWQQAVLPTPSSAELALSGPVVAHEGDGNPATIDVYGFRQDATSASLMGWSILPGDPPVVTQFESIVLSSTASSGIDLAICGDVAWALTETDLHRVDLVTGARTSLATAGTRVDCGAAPGGGVAALLVGGTVEILSAGLGVVSTEGHASAQDIAIVALGGAPAIGDCTTEGCSAVAWPWASDGAEALAWNDSSGVHVELADGTVVDLAARGTVSVGDVDGNGLPDLVALDSDDAGSIVSIVRSTGNGMGPLELYHHSLGNLDGAPIIGDTSGDGVPDLTAASATRIYLTK